MKQEKSDLLRNLSLSAIASIPYAGGVLAYILDKKLPEEISLRYNSFVDALEKDIITLKKELSYNRLETPEFYSMFTKVMNEVVTSHIEEKMILYRNILINTLDMSWNCRKNDFFFLITTQISPDAIYYLFCAYWNVFPKGYNNTPFSTSELLRCFPRQSNYIISFSAELTRFNLKRGTELTELGQQYCRFVFSPVHPNWQSDVTDC